MGCRRVGRWVGGGGGVRMGGEIEGRGRGGEVGGRDDSKGCGRREVKVGR